MSRVLVPRSDSLGAREVRPSDWEKYFCSDILSNQTLCGLVTTAGCGLAANIAIGNARVLGLHLNNDASCTVMCLTACSCNYIYMTLTRDTNLEPESWAFTTNTTGITPTDAYPISIATTNCMSVTSVTCTMNTKTGANTPANPHVYPHSITLGDYVTPCRVFGCSSIDNGCFSCSFAGFATQCAADTCWPTTCNCNARVDITTDLIDFIERRDCSSDAITHDLACDIPGCATTLSDTEWLLRFKLNITSITNVDSVIPSMVIGLYSLDRLTAGSAAQDAMTFHHLLRCTPTCCTWSAVSVNNSGPAGGASCATFACNFLTVANTPVYVEIKRTSATAGTLTVFCCACFSTVKGCLTMTPSACTTGLRYFGIKNRVGSVSCNTITIEVDCVNVWNNTNLPAEATCLMHDCMTCTTYSTTSVTNPDITICLGSPTDIVALAIHPNTATTETVLQIFASTSCPIMCFTCGERLRRINTTCLTDCAWNFIRFNRVATNPKYIRIQGEGGSAAILSVNEVKVLTPTTACIDKKHGHRVIHAYDSTLNLDGT